jgi:hypothetical protein
MKRALVVLALIGALTPGSAQAELREVRQVIFGMD